MNEKRILAVNVGSSSIKSAYYVGANRVFKAACRCIDLQNPYLEIEFEGQPKKNCKFDGVDIFAAFCSLLEESAQPSSGGQPDLVVHRVKFGGNDHTTRIIDNELIESIQAHSYLSSNHASFGISMIRACEEKFINAIQLAAFDSEFFSEMRDADALRGFRDSIFRRYSVIPTGHHGLACKAALNQAGQLHSNPNDTLLICQLGSGVSVTAVQNATPIANSMLVGASDGPMMNKRSGDLPPGILLSLIQSGYPTDRLWALLNEECGLFGASGTPIAGAESAADILHSASNSELTDYYARQIALRLVHYRWRFNNIGGLIFTGGVAEHSPHVVCLILKYYLEIGDGLELKADEFVPGSRPQRMSNGLIVSSVTIDEQTVLHDMAVNWLFHPSNLRKVKLAEARCICAGASKGHLVSLEAVNEFNGNVIVTAPLLTPELAYKSRFAAGLLISEGDFTSHGAAICREVNLPCLTGIDLNSLPLWAKQNEVFADFSAQEIREC